MKNNKTSLESFIVISTSSIIRCKELSAIELDKIKQSGEKALSIGNFTWNLWKVTFNGEKVYFVFNVPYEDAEILAKNFAQEQFLYIKLYDDNMCVEHYKTSNECITYKLFDAEKFNDEVSANAYIKKCGFDYQIDINELIKHLKPINNYNEFKASMDPVRTFMSRSSHRRASYITKN